MTLVNTAMQRMLAFKRDLSLSVIYGDFEMVEKCHAEEAYGHMTIAVDGDLDVSCLGCANTQRRQRSYREPDRTPSGLKFPLG